LKANKYLVLSGLALAVAVIIGVLSYCISYSLTLKHLLSESVQNAKNYVEVSAVSVNSVKKKEELLNVLKRAPYIQDAFVGQPKGKTPFTVTKKLLFPDGSLVVTVKLNEELLKSRASSLAKEISLSLTALSLMLIGFYLYFLKRLYLNPLNQIRKDVDKIYSGDYKKLPESGKGDEFDKIRKSINQMIDSIKKREERANVIARLLQITTTNLPLSEDEFLYTLQKVVKIARIKGMELGLIEKENDRVKIFVITPEKVEKKEESLFKIHPLGSYLIERKKEISTNKESVIKTLKSKGIKFVLGIPLKVGEEVLGYTIFCKDSEEEIKEEDRKFLKNVAQSLAVSLKLKSLIEDLKKKLQEEEKLKERILKSFVRGIEIRDSYTRGHSERVAYYSKRIAEVMGLGKEEAKQIYNAALLHDIGKIGIPDSILLKPDKLTPEEYELIKLHPILSYELVKPIELTPAVINGILYHHEKWDGSGYPKGLKGDDIPLPARIIAVADSFDAMTSARIYRKGMERKKAVKEIMALAGKSYDPTVVENAVPVFLKEKPEINEADYLDSQLIKELEERRLDYFLRDHLTGVFNRNALELAYQKAKERFKELSILVLDVKKLREINATKGWEEGDKILQSCVRALRESLKDAILVRYSGDNFVAFVPKSEEERVKETVRKVEEEFQITISVETLPPPPTVEELKRALTHLEYPSRV
jgi:HD-GYP domain-containing protein (c-di-GMP phosphodiesterase class II)/HAMP domain-containing protein